MTFCKASGLHKTTTGCDCEHCKPDARDFVAGSRSGKTMAFVEREVAAAADQVAADIRQSYRKFLSDD